MANTKNTTKVTKVNNTKETKNMKETKKAVKETKKVENAAKVDATVTIQDIEKLYSEAGIFTKPVKGNYRIMGAKKGGSSLNLVKGEFIIYSTDEDAQALVDAAIEGVNVTMKSNATDKTRPNTVVIATLDVLKKALKIYAKNEFNKIPATVTKED